MKSHLNYLVLLCSVLLFNACEKNLVVVDNTTLSENEVSLNPIIDFPKSPYSFELYLSMQNSNEEEKNINNSLLALGKAFSVLINNNNYVQKIYSKLSNNDFISINSLILDNEIRNALEFQLSLHSKNLDELLDEMNYEGVDYYPVVYFVNKSNNNLNIENKPIVSCGVSFDDTNSDTSSEYIMSWFGNQEILINNEISLNMTSPLFIITNHTNFSNSEKITIKNNELNYSLLKSNEVSNIWKNPYTNSYKIMYRYETSKYSEYSFVSCMHTTEGFYDFGKGGFTIHKIHKNDVGKTIRHLKHFTTQSIDNINNYLGMIFVTFEKDWYATKKDVLVNTNFGQKVAKCPMKFHNEYYQIAYLDKNSMLYVSQKGHILLVDENI